MFKNTSCKQHIKSKTKTIVASNVHIKNKMNSYCWPKILTQKYSEQKIIRLIMRSKCPVCGIKKSRFIKNKEAKSLLSNLGIKTPLSKLPLLNILFWMQFH